MTDDNKKPLQEIVDNTAEQISKDYKEITDEIKKKNGVTGTILIYVFFIIVIIISVLIFRKAISVGTEAFINNYKEQKEKVNDEIYQKFYDNAEKENHIRTNAVINLGHIREESKLEVMKVIESTCVIQTEDEERNGIHKWAKYTAEGIFTVDLTTSEFLVDNESHYVYIKIPEPCLTQFAILDDKTENLLYAFDKALFRWNGSFKQGVELSNDFQNRAYTQIKNSIYNNQEYLSTAKNRTKDELTKMIKILNSSKGMEDIKIEVEFY